MRTLNRLILRHWTLGLVILWIATIGVAGMLTFWSDSELWVAVASKYLFNTSGEYYFGTKPLFHFLTFLNFHLANLLGLHPMDTGRAFMILNFLGVCAAIFKIADRMHGRRVALMSMVVLMSISIFTKRAVELRSDILVTHLFLWWLYFRMFGTKKRALKSFVAVTFAALLITPKAMFWAIAMWPFLLEDIKIKTRLAAMGVLAAIAAVAAVIFTDPLAFFLRSFSADEVGFGYFDVVRLQHVFRFVFENAHFIFAFFLFSVMPGKDTSGPHGRRIRQISWTLMLVLLVYPDRLPFMIAALIPFFLLHFFTLPGLIKFMRSESVRAREARTAIIGLCAILSLHWGLSLRKHSNVRQRFAVDWLNREVKRYDGIQVFDPSGILVNYPAHNWFLGPGQSNKNHGVLVFIDKYKPEVLFYTGKAHFLQPHIDEVLRKSYAGDGAGIFVRRVLIDSPGRYINTSWLRGILRDEYPRLAGNKKWEWVIFWRDSSGAELRERVDWEVFEKNIRLPLPPGTERVAIQPFEFRFPFNSNLVSLFSFDAGY
jgi:hypothetical protein